MPEGAKWRFSVVSEGKLSDVQVENRDGRLWPTPPTDLFPAPLNIIDALPVDPMNVLGLPDRSVLARREGSDTLFMFTTKPPEAKPPEPTQDEPPQKLGFQGLMTAVAARFKSEFRAPSEAELSPVLGILRREDPNSVLTGIRALPAEEAEDLALIPRVAEGLLENGMVPDRWEAGFLRQLKLVAERRLQRI